MKRIYKTRSPLSTVLEWLATLMIGVWFVRMVIHYIYQNLGIILAIIIFIIGTIIGYRIYDYKKRTRF